MGYIRARWSAWRAMVSAVGWRNRESMEIAGELRTGIIPQHASKASGAS